MYWSDLSPETNIYKNRFCGFPSSLNISTNICLHTRLAPTAPNTSSNKTLTLGHIWKTNLGVRSLCERRRKPQAQLGTLLSASACDPRERTSPHHLIHHLTARTTAMTTCSIATTVAWVTCSLATAIALSNRQVTWAGHTLTALILPHPHLLLLLLPLQTGLRSLEERIPHLGERFEWSTPRPNHPLPPTHSHISTNVINTPYWNTWYCQSQSPVACVCFRLAVHTSKVKHTQNLGCKLLQSQSYYNF